MTTTPASPVFVSVGSQGRVLRTPHDGRIPVNGGLALVRTAAGRTINRILARCKDCQSRYFFMAVDGAHNFARRCPHCALADRRRQDADWRARNRDADRRRGAAWRDRNREHYRARARRANAAAYERKRAAKYAARTCRQCNAAIPLSAHGDTRYCADPCRRAAQREACQRYRERRRQAQDT